MADDERRGDDEAGPRGVARAVEAVRTGGLSERRAERRDARGDDEALLEATKREAACGRELAAAHARIAELEAARSPQGEDHEVCRWPNCGGDPCETCPYLWRDWKARAERAEAARFPQGEDHIEAPETMFDVEPQSWEETAKSLMREKVERVVQADDHEAGETAAAKALYPILHAVSRGDSPELLLSHAVRVTLNAYLSRVFPSRDGTVAVEDVAAWLETDRRKTGVRCRYCGEDELRDICPESDRGIFSCSPRTVPVESYAEAFLAEFSPASTGDRE